MQIQHKYICTASQAGTRLTRMLLEAAAMTVGLDREESLRLQGGTQLEVACLFGVVWITQAGDLRDLFLAPGESMRLALRGLVLITALEPAAVKVRQVPASDAAFEPSACSRTGRTVFHAQKVWSRWRSSAVTKLRIFGVG